jgi:hypothetical protein
MINVSHDGNDRRAILKQGLVFGGLDLSLLNLLQDGWRLGDLNPRSPATMAAVSKSSSWLMVAMMPFFMSALIMSTGVRCIRSASSLTVNAAGSSTVVGTASAACLGGV